MCFNQDGLTTKGDRMGMRITTNMASINAQRWLTKSQSEMQKSVAQISSGSRITKAADDAAGLAISESLKSQIRSYSQASRNASDGISLVQVAEGGLTETSNIITRLRELSIQSASDTVSDIERGYIDKESQQLKEEIQRIAKTSKFGNSRLLDGTFGHFEIQVGIHNTPVEDRIAFNGREMDATLNTLNLQSVDLSKKEGAQNALGLLDSAQGKVSALRATLGAIQNRLQSTVDNIAVQHENLSGANSRIRDADLAQSAAEVARNQVLLQATTAMASQANQQSSLALKLLG